MVQIIDCAVHPSVRQGDELREYMQEPWRSRPFPGPERYFYPAPMGEYWIDAQSPGALAGSDPSLLSRHLFDTAGIDYAVLLPLTRGLLPDTDRATAICTATNDWMADTWLGRYNSHGRFRGSIRINPGDPAEAIREIERWAGHPHMVQVAVPLQAQHPYGQRAYFPIWEAAARHHLPVAVHADGGAGIEFWPSAVGYYRTYVEYRTLYPANSVYHLVSLIAEGVFERLEGLVFVFADGAYPLLAPLMWRMDKNWRPTHRDAPWTTRPPTSYLPHHVRFCTDRFEVPADTGECAEWIEMTGAGDLLLFASNYPCWDFYNPRQAFEDIPPNVRQRVLADNARLLYKL
jgi:predicted TIM-barrel fold metal-dependent hydrolase